MRSRFDRRCLDDPELVLHDKPVRLANMRYHGRKHVFVVCGNPDCHGNAELDISGLPDNVTFGDLKPGMLAAPSAIIAGLKSAVMAAP